MIALWSAPRCRSTAFLRMMVERGDHLVVHEPFSQVVDRGEVEVAGRTVRGQSGVLAALADLSRRGSVFFKDTTDFHYPEVLADREFLATAIHTFIVRHPAEAIASHRALNPALGRDEIGFARLCEIFDAVRDVTGSVPVVVDSDDLVDRPEPTARAYCEAVGIPFLPQALDWRPGMRPEWLPTRRWHEATSRTSGFVRRGAGHGTGAAAGAVSTDPELAAHLAYHLPYYERLLAFRLRP